MTKINVHESAACKCGRGDKPGPFHNHECPVFLAWSNRKGTAMSNDPVRCQCERCLSSREGQCRYPKPNDARTGRCVECRKICK